MNIEDARILLGATRESSPGELRTLYRRRLHELHPDVRGGEAEAAADTRELIEAYQLVLHSAEPVEPATRLEPFNADSGRSPDRENSRDFRDIDDTGPVATAQRHGANHEPVATRIESESVGNFTSADDDMAVHDLGAANWINNEADGVWLIGTDTLAVECPADETYALLVDAAYRIGDVTHVDRSSHEFLEFLVRSTSGDAISVVCSLQGRANGTTEAFITLEPLATARGPLPDVGEVARLMAELIRERLVGA